MRVAASAQRALAHKLPEAVAAAVVEFITGDLLLEPRRVGKALGADLMGKWSARRGTYRVLYELDEQGHTVVVLDAQHRATAYRRS